MKLNLVAAVLAAAFLFVFASGSAQANTFTVTCPLNAYLNGAPYAGPTPSGFRQASISSGPTITCSYPIIYRPTTRPTGTSPNWTCPPLPVGVSFNGPWAVSAPFTEAGTLQKTERDSVFICQYNGGIPPSGALHSVANVIAPNYILTASVTEPANDTCAVKASDQHQVVCTVPTPICPTDVAQMTLYLDTTKSSLTGSLLSFSGTIYVNGKMMAHNPSSPSQTTAQSFYSFFNTSLGVTTLNSKVTSWTPTTAGTWTNASQTDANCTYGTLVSTGGWTGNFQVGCSGGGCSF